MLNLTSIETKLKNPTHTDKSPKTKHTKQSSTLIKHTLPLTQPHISIKLARTSTNLTPTIPKVNRIAVTSIETDKHIENEAYFTKSFC